VRRVPSALIVDGGATRGALVGSRSLHHAGWEVGLGSPDPRGLASSSRSTHAWHEVPPVAGGVEPFVDAVNRAVGSGGYEVVFCATNAEVLALSAHRDRIPAVVPYPPHASVLRVLDKLELVRMATAVGLAAPRTVAATPAELDGLCGPVAVKARLPCAVEPGRAPSRFDAFLCSSRQEASTRCDDIVTSAGQPLLQEVLRGSLVHHTVVVGLDGGIVARAQQVSEPLVFPPRAGTAVRSSSTVPDPDLSRRCEAFLREAGWTGLASMQFILGADGVCRLVDVDVAFVMHLQLAIAGGADLPAIWAAHVTGRPVPPAPPPREGLRLHWLEGDLRRAVAERRRGLVRDVVGCLGYAVGAEHTLIRLDDPWPLLRSVPACAYRRIGRRLQRVRA
jgi:predicted ATP-grasp superfamily ATP-dependent carboligase